MWWVVSWISTFHGKPFLLERMTSYFESGIWWTFSWNELSLLLQGKQQFAAKDKMWVFKGELELCSLWAWHLPNPKRLFWWDQWSNQCDFLIMSNGMCQYLEYLCNSEHQYFSNNQTMDDVTTWVKDLFRSKKD